MLNNQEFVKRLQKVISYHGESAASFAEKIGVQRSSISHILSGRNKPSLDFVMKVLSHFPEVELYWLLNGKGEFPKKEHSINESANTAILKPEADLHIENKNTPISRQAPLKEYALPKTASNKSIDRIVIFFTDGSFQNFENS
ncbi:MAG: helix-turn-helix domain-containing protein [Oceanihabitans sp.]